MPDLDEELLERVARWCAETGRATVPAEIRRALGALGWDELLAVRALLADPPRARPLGPFALADLARGVPAETAAERERDGTYPAPEGGDPSPEAAPEPAAPPAARQASARGAPRLQGPVIRRARDAAPPAPAPAPRLPLVDELLLPEGRAVLDRLVRRHGARRHALVAALAQGWRSADDRAVDGATLERLLDHHGLARAFARRERDELLHALRAAGGLRTAAAARLGLAVDELDAALARAGAAADAERIREARRAEVRARATLAERVRMLLADPARLEDLGVLGEVEEDLRRRLPEHVRAVGAAGGPLLGALARSLSIGPDEAKALVDRLGVPVAAARSGAPNLAAPRAARGTPGARPGRTGAGSAGPRPPSRGAGGFRPPSRPAGGSRPPSRPMSGSRPPSRPMGGSRPPSRPMGGSRPPSRPMSGSRPTGGSRPPSRPMGGSRPPSRPMGGSRPPSRPMSGSRPPSRPMGGSRPAVAGGPRRGPGGGRPRPAARSGAPGGKPPPRGPRRGGR